MSYYIYFYYFICHFVLLDLLQKQILNIIVSMKSLTINRIITNTIIARKDMPYIFSTPDCGSKTLCCSASEVNLPQPVGPSIARFSRGMAVKLRSATAGRLP